MTKIVKLLVVLSRRDDPVTEFSLKTHSSSRELKAAIDKIVQKGGLSNVGKRPSASAASLHSTCLQTQV